MADDHLHNAILDKVHCSISHFPWCINIGVIDPTCGYICAKNISIGKDGEQTNKNITQTRKSKNIMQRELL